MGERSRVAAYARFLRLSFSVNLQAVAEYRANFLIQVFGMMLNNGAFALFWGVLVARTGGVGGYGFGDIMFVWAVVSTAYGIAHVLFGNIRQIGRIVMEGELDLYLLQPKDVFINVIASRTIVSAWGDLLYGYIVICFLPDFGPGRLLLFTLLSLSGALVFTAVFSAAESLTLFIGNSGAISGAVTEFLLSFSLYPESIHGPGTRWLLYSLVPSGFIAFVPLRAWKEAEWLLVPLLALVGAAYLLGAYLLFRKGLRRYESGNQIGMRS